MSEFELYEKTLASQQIFDGKILELWHDEVELPNGRKTHREVVRHRGAAAVVALTDDQNVILVRQFRYPYGKVLTEIPAGKLEPNEEPLTCAKRELKEETGYGAAHFYRLSSIYCSPAYCDETIHLFLATGLMPGESRPDEGEFLQTVKLPLQEVVACVMRGEIPDSKTQSAILQTAYLLEHRKDLFEV